MSKFSLFYPRPIKELKQHFPLEVLRVWKDVEVNRRGVEDLRSTLYPKSNLDNLTPVTSPKSAPALHLLGSGN